MKVKPWRAFFHMQRFLRSITPSLLSTRHYSYLGDWESPEGFDTGIMIHNSANNQKVPLKLQRKNIATWYICGPTVYAESHIGHACCYVKFDIIKRIMEKFFNVNVLLLMGITDIDDKIIKQSLEMGISTSEVAKRYEFEFFEDMTIMRVEKPLAVARVTENISSIVSFIQKLIEKEFAYVTDEGNVYFIVSKSKSSNVLNEMPDELQTVIDPLKRDKRDFALWKSAKPGEPSWPSPWGNGRPGWHIECSAMASNLFGSQLDIHSGGFDLLFPHHMNEKSQSEAYHGCSQWVNYWLHSGLLQIGNEEKMSKSIKNTISIKEFLKENTVNDFRILCLQSLYRNNVSYSAEILNGAKGIHSKFHNFMNDCEAYINQEYRISSNYEEHLIRKLKDTKKKVVSILADDFNTSQALLSLTDLVDEVNFALQSPALPTDSTVQSVTSVAACSNYINQILEIFGVNIISKQSLKPEYIYFVDKSVRFRDVVRLFALCQLKNDEAYSPVQFISKKFADVEAIFPQLSNLEESSQSIQNIKYAVNTFHKESLDFISTLPETESICLENDKKIVKVEKRKRAHLLSLCDALRSSFHENGIVLKDRRDHSDWFPMTSWKL